MHIQIFDTFFSSLAHSSVFLVLFRILRGVPYSSKGFWVYSEGAAPPLKQGKDEMEVAEEPVKVEIEELVDCSTAPEELKEDDPSKLKGEILGSS